MVAYTRRSAETDAEGVSVAAGRSVCEPAKSSSNSKTGRPGTKQSTGLKEEEGVRFCDQLFRIEQELKDLSPDERKRHRQELSQPLLEVSGNGYRSFAP